MKLAKFREMTELSQSEVAKRIGVDVSTVSRYETKDIRPSLGVLLKIKKMSGNAVDIEDFIDENCTNTKKDKTKKTTIEQLSN